MSILKELQDLPTRCSNAAEYLSALLGIAILTLLCYIVTRKSNSLEILLNSQCALSVRKSWAANARDTLHKYDMGTIDDIFESDIPASSRIASSKRYGRSEPHA